MKVLSRKFVAVISASILISSLPGIAAAQSLSDVNDVVPPQTIDGPFAQWGIPTPPGAEGYEVNQATAEELDPQGLEEWQPTINPNSEVIPGHMRSDREEIIAGVNKAEADKAEVREAQLAAQDARTMDAGPGCAVVLADEL